MVGRGDGEVGRGRDEDDDEGFDGSPRPGQSRCGRQGRNEADAGAEEMKRRIRTGAKEKRDRRGRERAKRGRVSTGARAIIS